MIRSKLSFLGAAVVLVASSLGLATSASATTTLFNTSAATVTCNSIIASTATLAPPLTTASSGTAVIKVKGTLNGCTSSGALVGVTPQEPTIVSGSFSGTLNTVGAPACIGLLAPATITGNLTVKYKVASGQKLDHASTILSGGTITGGVFVGPAAAYGQFTLAGQTYAPNSAFTGGPSTTVATTSEDVIYLGGACGAAPPGPGVKTIHLAMGTVVA